MSQDEWGSVPPVPPVEPEAGPEAGGPPASSADPPAPAGPPAPFAGPPAPAGPPAQPGPPSQWGPPTAGPPPGWAGTPPSPYYGSGYGSGYGPPPQPRPNNGRRNAVVVSVVVLAAAIVIAAVVAHGKSNNNTSTGSANHATARPSLSASGTPAGYTNFTSAADRFRLAVPSSWRQIDMNSPGAQAAMNEVAQANPAYKSTFAQGALKMAESGMVLMAINPVPDASGFASNVNVVAKPAPGFSQSDLQQLAAVVPAQLARVGITVTGTSTATIGGQAAMRMAMTQTLNTPTGTQLTVDETQYYVGANDFLFVITLSGDDPALTTIPSTFATT